MKRIALLAVLCFVAVGCAVQPAPVQQPENRTIIIERHNRPTTPPVIVAPQPQRPIIVTPPPQRPGINIEIGK